MAETKLSASQIIITASDIGAAGAYETMPEPSADNLGKIVQYTGTDTTGETEVVSGIVQSEYFAEGDNYTITIDFDKDTFNSYNEYTQTHPITSDPNVSLDIYYAGNPEKGYFTVTYNTDNVLEVEMGLNGEISNAMTKAVMASIGFGVANDEEPFDFYGEEPIELVLPTMGTGEAYTQGYFYKCVSNGNSGNSNGGENSTGLDPVTIVNFEGKEDGGVAPSSITFSKAIYDSYDPEHPELTGGEQVELSFEGEEADETYIEYATAYFPNLGEDGYTTRVEITEEFGVESAFAQMGFFITISEEFGVPGWISCTMPAEYSSSSETVVLIQKYVSYGSVELQIDDIHTFGSDFSSNTTSQIKFTCTNPTTQTFNWKNLATGTTGTISLTDCDCISCEQPNKLTEYDRFIYQYIAGESSSGSEYSWNQIDVQPNPSGAQYEYTAELEFTPNVDSEGAIIIELAGDNVATLQIGQYVSYEDSGVWDDPVEDAVYTAFMQPSSDTSVGASKILWTSPVNRLIWMEGYAGTGQNGQSILNMKYQYAVSGLAEDHCKIVLKIVSDKELTITATKDPSEFVMDIGAGIMSLPIPLYQESDQTMFYPVQQGGIINWEPIPEVESLPSQTGNSGKFLTTDGTDASWSDKPLVNTATGTNAIGIGEGTTATGNYSIGCGYYNKANGTRSIVIGYGCETTATNGIIISPVNHKQNQQNLIIGRCNDYIAQDCIVLNSTDSTLDMTPSRGDFVVKNDNHAARVLMSADGTIPTDRFTGSNTTPANAGQYMLTITKDSNGNITRSWEPVVTPSTPATTPVLQGTSTYWIEDQVTHIITQTITVQGVTASNTIFVAPAPASSADYAAAGIICTAQNTNQLTFTCTTIPANNIEVNIVIL